MRLIILITALFCSFNLSALAAAEGQFASPRKTFQYYLKSMKSYKLGNQHGLTKAIKTFNDTNIDPAIRTGVLTKAANELIQTLDRLEYVDIKTVPSEWSESKWVYKQQNVELAGVTHNVEISLELVNKNWKFSEQTLSTIEYYYQSVKNKDVVKGVVKLTSWKEQIKMKMPAWTGAKTLGLFNGQWLGLVALIILAAIIDRMARFYIRLVLEKVFNRKKLIFSDRQKRSVLWPSGMAVFTLVWMYGIRLLEFNPSLLSILVRGSIILLTVVLVALSHNLVDVLSGYLQQLAEKSENKFDDILVPLVSKSAKTFVFIVGFIFIGDSLTLNMKNILAGLGIGGLAFALAAKDTLSNLFGSLTVLLDRPFRIGDWVVVGDGVEGTVEEVGLRSTRIRTFYNSLITLPNGNLTNSKVDNYGRRTYRRYNTNLGIQYDTPPELIETFCEGIRQIILNHPHTRKDYFHVYLNHLSDSSLNILLYVFWQVPDWSCELQERHRLLVDIMRLAKELGVEFAFPTQTLHLHNQPNDTNYQSVSADQFEQLAKVKAREICDAPLSFMDHRSSEEQYKA
jgi:MscS family membrane protein